MSMLSPPPAGRVAGGGKWLTSDTDKIIADLVAMFPLKIMAPDTSIVLAEGDDSRGHNFSGVSETPRRSNSF